MPATILCQPPAMRRNRLSDQVACATLELRPAAALTRPHPEGLCNQAQTLRISEGSRGCGLASKKPRSRRNKPRGKKSSAQCVILQTWGCKWDPTQLG